MHERDGVPSARLATVIYTPPSTPFNARRLARLLALAAALALLALPALGRPAAGATLPPGFSESIVWSGLTNPMAVRFAPDGRIFVAEKSGRIKVFDSLADQTPTVVADLSGAVQNWWDRGLLGLAIDPAFPTRPYVYVLYTYDSGGWGDACPTPPGPTTDGCVVHGRLSRLQLQGDVATSEQVLIQDWCQQFPSHSVGDLAFGPDGALYASAGEGASFNFVDYGQAGSPKNPCGDPPSGSGTALTPPSAEGGALRSQDLRTAGDPVTLDGSIIRVDPNTGAGLPSNPLAGQTDANARRIIAHGFRNPFRFAFRPGTSELWVGDVGWNDWEEIDRIPNTTDAVMENFGWPCYEGPSRQSGYDSADLAICENLYSTPGAVTSPYFDYHHTANVVAGESCPTGGSSVTGQAFQFYSGGPYPAEYDGTLFFADYTRNCIWAMRQGGNGLPAPGLLKNFVSGAASPVDIQISPGGELVYADLNGGTVRIIKYGVDPPPSGRGQGRRAPHERVQHLTAPPMRRRSPSTGTRRADGARISRTTSGGRSISDLLARSTASASTGKQRTRRATRSSHRSTAPTSRSRQTRRLPAQPPSRPRSRHARRGTSASSA